MEEKSQKNSANVSQLVLVGLLIVASFFIGMLWTKVRDTETTGAGAAGKANGNPSANNGAAPSGELKVESAEDLDPVTQNDYVRGNRNARYALVEYSDVECPFCGRFHQTAKQLLSENSDKVMWVYRDFPLDSLHPTTRKKSEAAKCVGKLGGNDKYWSFLDELYTNQSMKLEELPALAKKVGVNETAFKNCYDKEEMADAVVADYDSGLKAGVNGTPGNILLDTKTGKTIVVPGAVPYAQLQTYFSKIMAE